MDGGSIKEGGDNVAIRNIEAYVLSSNYRSNVVKHLAAEKRATPKDIADATDNLRPHVSRALSELRAVGVVELQVAETRTVGRYYGLTESGATTWENVKDEIRTIRWSIEEPDSEARTVVDVAKDEFGETLRAVGAYDHDEFVVQYVRADVRSNYSEEAFEELLCTLFLDNPLDELEIPDSDCRSETIQFDDFVVLRVRSRDDTRILISFEEPQNVSIPEFSERVSSVVDD